MDARRRSGTPFLEAYERLVAEHGADGGETEVHAKADAFFGAEGYAAAGLRNTQPLDLDGLKGRLLSSSYAPTEGEPGSEAMLRDLQEIFRAHESAGVVTMEYDTLVYCGRLR